MGETPTDVSILLPLGTREKFPDLLGDLEDILSNKKNPLRIKGCGISMTSLEDVFLRITQEDIRSPNTENNNNGKSEYVKVSVSSPESSMKKMLLTGNYPPPNWTTHFKLLFQMKVCCDKYQS